MIRTIAASVGAIAAASFMGFAHAAETPRVGVTSAVNPSAAGTPPGAATRQLFVGNDVVFRERVITTDDGQAQILFLDQSSLMIGPNSTVTIDEFVYDPNTSKGNIAATLTQGSFRYIGGKLSKQGNATLKTPVATIGIRGSDVTVTFDAVKRIADVVTTHGSANVQTLGGILGLRTGFGTTIGAGGTPQANALTSAQIAAANKIFEGQPGKIAGAGELPTDKRVADSQLGSAIEAQRLASIEPAAGGNAGSSVTLPIIPPPRPEDNGLSPVVPQSTTTQNNNQNGSNGGNAGTGNPPPPPPPPRTANTLNGYVAGFGTVSSTNSSAAPGSGSSGGRSVTLTNDAPTDVEIRTIPDADGNGRTHAKFNFRGTNTHRLSGAEIQMGDAPGSAPATKSLFVDDTTFLATQDAAASAGVAQLKGAQASASGVMVTIPALALGGVSGAPNDTLCVCEFVTWGVWQATLEAPSTQKSLDVPLALWVAGKLPNVTDPSPTGTATFSGTALGLVQNQSQSYAATGAFTNVYSFTNRTGNVSISNFDGKSFGGQVNAISSTDWRSYSGSLSGSNLNGSINGSFYGNRDANGQLQQPRETAGNFNVKNQGYSASGIFVGRR